MDNIPSMKRNGKSFPFVSHLIHMKLRTYGKACCHACVNSHLMEISIIILLHFTVQAHNKSAYEKCLKIDYLTCIDCIITRSLVNHILGPWSMHLLSSVHAFFMSCFFISLINNYQEIYMRTYHFVKLSENWFREAYTYEMELEGHVLMISYIDWCHACILLWYAMLHAFLFALNILARDDTACL